MKEALAAIAKAGYYGESNHETYRIADGDASDAPTDMVEVSGVHLCCGKCVSSVDDALESIEGATGHLTNVDRMLQHRPRV